MTKTSLPSVSIIIPTLNEEKLLRNTIEHTFSMASGQSKLEVLVVDAGSTDDTMASVHDLPIKSFVKPSFKLKKYQSLNFGIQQSQGDLLIFLDADTLLPKHFDILIQEKMATNQYIGGAFEMRFQSNDLKLILLSRLNSIRYRIWKTFYGDQALFCKRQVADQLHGFPETLMEAAFFCKRMKTLGKLALIHIPVLTSPRRFMEGGFWKVLGFDVLMWLRFMFGLSLKKQTEKYWKSNLDKPLVSIIMATKDTEPYLPACLDSILAQTYQNWELIAINDHSSDRTPQILYEYAARDERIHVFHSLRHKLIPTLKEGYKYVNGDLINRMDSDDKMPPDKIEVLVNKWQKYGKGHIIAGGTEHFVDEGEVGDGFRRYEQWLNEVAKTSTHYQQIYRECVIPSHSWIVHKEDLDAVDAFNPEVYPEDYDLCFRFYQGGLKVIGIDKVLHYWRDRSDRISRTWDEYKDNRYFDLKTKYFYKMDRDRSRPLVLWGAGTNGKDLAKLLLDEEETFHWVCDNERKIGKHVYTIKLEDFEVIPFIRNPQIIIAVTSPQEKDKIEALLKSWGKEPVQDYWFFL